MPSALAWWKPKASTRPAWRKATFANNLRRKSHSAVSARPRTLRRPPSSWPPRKRPGSRAKRCASQAVCDSPPPRRPASFIYRGGGLGIVPPRHRRGRQHAPRSDLSASKDGFRNEGGHDVVRHVHHVADAQIRRASALQHAEAPGDGRAHLNGGDTHLAVALSEVAVAG